MIEICETISALLLKYFLNNNRELYLFKPVSEINPKGLLNHAKKLIKELGLNDYIEVCLHEVIIELSGIQMEKKIY